MRFPQDLLGLHCQAEHSLEMLELAVDFAVAHVADALPLPTVVSQGGSRISDVDFNRVSVSCRRGNAVRWLQREQEDVIAFLREENRVLKARLEGQRIRFDDRERRRLG